MNDKETQEKKPEYEAPQIITYTEEELLEELGPAQANMSAYDLTNPSY